MASQTSSRVPRTISDFNAYIANTNTYLLAGAPTNFSRLGLVPTDMTQWTAFNTQWTPLYTKYSDKKNSRTTAIKDSLRLVMKQFTAFAQPLLDRIAASGNVLIADLQTFRIKKGVLHDATVTRRRASVAVQVTFSMQALGGGDIKFSCRATHDSKRASIPQGANAVEVRYKIGDPAPNSTDDCPQNQISTKAIFTVHAGGSNAGKKLYAYARWIVTTDPNRNGSWGVLQSVMIG